MFQDAEGFEEEDEIMLSSHPDMIPAKIQKAVVLKLKKRFKPG